jgi:hypothetical protein
MTNEAINKEKIGAHPPSPPSCTNLGSKVDASIFLFNKER